jgi:hypothetical protein
MITLRTTALIMTVGFAAAGCKKSENKKQAEAPVTAELPKEAPPQAEPPPPAAQPVAEPAQPEKPMEPATAEKKLFIDVHEIGPGKVTLAQVEEAHKKDLAVQEKYGVNFKSYWLDQKNGRVYCLSEAPNAEAPSAAHKEAHGGVPAKVIAVAEPEAAVEPAGGKGKKLFLDIHRVGPGKITAEAVQEAHQKDLAAQGKHGVKFLNYWVDADSGTVFCLSEAANAKAPNQTHKEAHGGVADEVVQVAQGH